MPAPVTRDYFAELYVAGLFGDAGWAVYFPKRDVGFDFVATKLVENETLIRAVQVKGLYPTESKTDKATYGYKGDLSARHADMVLVLPYFSVLNHHAPQEIAYMPADQMKAPVQGGVRCVPAMFKNGNTVPRQGFGRYFGQAGLKLVESSNWGKGA